jgi:fibronectin type 3 domain-containing protein
MKWLINILSDYVRKILSGKASLTRVLSVMLVSSILIQAAIFSCPLPVKASFSMQASLASPNIDTSVNLQWLPVANASYYRIYRDNLIIKYIDMRFDKNYTSYTDIGLTPETTYTYTVKAYDLSYNEIADTHTTITTEKMLPPTGLSSYYNINTGEVTLSWINNSSAAQRTIIRQVNGPEIMTVGSGVSTYRFYISPQEANLNIHLRFSFCM